MYNKTTSLFSMNILDLELEHAKMYLTIDEFFTEDDDFIIICLESAKSYIQSYLNWGKLSDIPQEELPTELSMACLMLMGHYYQQRKIVDTNTDEVDMTLSSILSLHKNYTFGVDIDE